MRKGKTMKKKEKIYLAGAFFNNEERATISFLADKLRKQGHDVYVPMEHKVPNEWDIPNDVWGNAVFNDDVAAIKKCTCLVVVYTGMVADAGTVWEIGFAYGIKKRIYVIHNYDMTKDVASLMVWNGCTVNIDMKTLDDPKWTKLKKDTIKIEQK
jgi:nucleoside 2-deoxyribosyltransferase